MDRGSYVTSRKVVGFFCKVFLRWLNWVTRDIFFCLWRPYLKNGFLLMDLLSSSKTRSLFLSQNLRNNKIKLSELWMGKWFTMASPKLSHSLINNQNQKTLQSSIWHLNLWKKNNKPTQIKNWNFQNKCKVGWNLPYSPSNNTNPSSHLPCCCKRPTHRAAVGDTHPSYLTQGKQGFQVGHQLQFPQRVTPAPSLLLLEELLLLLLWAEMWETLKVKKYF